MGYNGSVKNSESQPLDPGHGKERGLYTDMMEAHMSEAAKMAADAMAGTAACGAVEEAKKWKKTMEDGPQTFRRMALLGGVAMTVFGFTGIISRSFSLSPIGAVIQVYITLFGLVVLMLESKQFLKTAKFEMAVRKYWYFCALVQGRGIFYIFLGSLALGQWDLVNMVVGCYMILTGFLCFTAGTHANVKLKSCRKVLKDEKAVKEAFYKFDADHNGCLDIGELKLLAASLGSEMSPNEMEASMLIMDTDGDAKLDFNEFMQWWVGGTGSSYLV